MKPSVDFKKIQLQFTNYLRNPEDAEIPDNIEPRRMAIYEELVFNNIESFLSNGFPVIRSLYSEKHWLDIVQQFIKHHRCETPLFAEITLEFIDYISSKGRYLLEEYPFLLELAHYEWVEVSVIYADEENVSESELLEQSTLTDEQWLSLSPRVSSMMHLLAYEYPVQQISRDNIPTEKSETGVFLTVYRNLNDEIGFMELNAVSYRLLESIDGEISGQQLIDNLGYEMGYEDNAKLYPQAIEMMKGFKQRNILLGAFKTT